MTYIKRDSRVNSYEVTVRDRAGVRHVLTLLSPSAEATTTMAYKEGRRRGLDIAEVEGHRFLERVLTK